MFQEVKTKPLAQGIHRGRERLGASRAFQQGERKRREKTQLCWYPREKTRSRRWQVWFLLRLLSFAWRCLPPHCVFAWPFLCACSERENPGVPSSSYKDISSTREESHPITPPERPHLQRQSHWNWASTYKFGQTQFRLLQRPYKVFKVCGPERRLRGFRKVSLPLLRKADYQGEKVDR